MQISIRETSVRAVIPLVGKSKLVVSGLPGLEISRVGAMYLDPCSAELSLQFLQSLRTKLLYILVEDFEMPPHTLQVLQEHAESCDIELRFMPVVDFGAPSLAFEEQWKLERTDRSNVIKAGHSIGLACAYGAGRSGMMTAAIVCENGMASEEAVAFVRNFFPEAVGSLKQEKWVAAGNYLS